MELFFIFSALRRYFWVVLLCAVVGAAVGFVLADTEGDGGFESRGVLLVSPPDEQAPGVFTGDSDRYVDGQLTVLGSQELAGRVAERLGDGTSPEVVRHAVRFEVEPRSNVVTIIAENIDGAFARNVVNLYLDAYLDLLHEEVESAQADEIEELDREIERTRASLTEIDLQIEEISAPFIGDDGAPSLEQIAPGLASEKDLLVERLRSLESSRISELGVLQVSTVVGEPATVPTPVPRPTAIIAVSTGTLGGAFVGFVLTLLLASTTQTLLGDQQAKEILGRSIVGTFPVLRGVAHDRGALFDTLEPSASEIVSALVIQIEAVSGEYGPVSVVVTGTGSEVGTTTVATSLARGFADTGAQTLLVDGNLRHPELIERFGDDNPSPGGHGAPDGILLRSLGAALGQTGEARPDRRPDMRTMVVNAGEGVDVIVVDGGALTATPTTARLATSAGAVVLVMSKQQTTRGLEATVRQLDAVETILPVRTPVRTRRGATRITR